VVALGLVPVIAIMFSSKEESRFSHIQEEYAEKARVWYATFLGKILDNKRTQNIFMACMGIAFVAALALPITGIVKATFFPQQDGDFLYADIELPQGSALEQTDLVARAVEEALYSDKDIESFVTSVGNTSSFGNSPASGSRFANITINLPVEHKESSTDVVTDVTKRLSTIEGATIRVGQPSGGPPVGAAVDIKIEGNDQTGLNDTLSAAQTVLSKIPGVTNIDTSNKNSGTELKISIDRAKLAQFGLTPASVASTLRSAINGTKATSISGGTRNVDVVVMMNLNPNFTDPYEASHVSLDAIKQIPIITPSGQSILLGSVISENLAWANTTITHENRLREVELTADTTGNTTVAEVVAAFNAGMKSVTVPQGIVVSIGGQNAETNKSFTEMFFALIGGLALMFIILVVAFNSFRFTSYLLLVIPLSLIGVIFGLAVTGEPLSFPSLLGVIALAGVIINHAIILMDSIIQRIKLTPERNWGEIVIESAVSRLRPIVLTTITTVLGMIPLMFAGGLWAPLAFSIFFGLSFAMILTLVLIPVMVHRWPGNYKKLFHSEEVKPTVS
jgi:HAE1 family hydrophobic/amphiphilic exporter-1